jgi:hypothetical protein
LLLNKTRVKHALALLFMQRCGLRRVYEIELFYFGIGVIAVIIIGVLKTLNRQRVGDRSRAVFCDLRKALCRGTICGFQTCQICKMSAIS